MIAGWRNWGMMLHWVKSIKYFWMGNGLVSVQIPFHLFKSLGISDAGRNCHIRYIISLPYFPRGLSDFFYFGFICFHIFLLCDLSWCTMSLQARYVWGAKLYYLYRLSNSGCLSKFLVEFLAAGSSSSHPISHFLFFCSFFNIYNISLIGLYE